MTCKYDMCFFFLHYFSIVIPSVYTNKTFLSMYTKGDIYRNISSVKFTAIY